MDRRRGVGDASTAKSPLLPQIDRCVSRRDDELRWFRNCLRWTFMDQSTTWSAVLSYLLFAVLGLAVPALSQFVLSYRPERLPYNGVVQLSLSAASAVSFFSLSFCFRRYGLRRALFIDKLPKRSLRVQEGYAARLSRSFKLLAAFVAPCFLAEAAYKMWWYAASVDRVALFGLDSSVGCAAGFALELASWMYRTATYFLNCVLFELTCHLQGLRLLEFAAVLHDGRDNEEMNEVSELLKEHLDIRKRLKVISHRFRAFIVACTLLVTASQFASVLVATRRESVDDIFYTAELALCSIMLVAGLVIMLSSAARITHQAQALTGLAAKWHASCTVESAVNTPIMDTSVDVLSSYHQQSSGDSSDDDDSSDDYLGNMKVVPGANTLSFQKRQALVTYLENNRAGLTVFGFTLDRTYLHTIFTLEWTLFLWLLGKTIGIS